MSSLFFCVGSSNRDIQCFAVSITPYVLYAYLRAYAAQTTIFCFDLLCGFITSTRSIPAEGDLRRIPGQNEEEQRSRIPISLRDDNGEATYGLNGGCGSSVPAGAKYRQRRGSVFLPERARRLHELHCCMSLHSAPIPPAVAQREGRVIESVSSAVEL